MNYRILTKKVHDSAITVAIAAERERTVQEEHLLTDVYFRVCVYLLQPPPQKSPPPPPLFGSVNLAAVSSPRP